MSVYMTKLTIIALVTSLASACIFGGGTGKDDNVDSVDATNDENNLVDVGPGPDMATLPDAGPPEDQGSIDAGQPDTGTPAESYLQLTVTPQPCASPSTRWFRPDDLDSQVRLLETSHVVTGGAARDSQAGFNAPFLGSDATVAFATKDGSNIGVYAAAVVADANSDADYVAVSSASFNIDTSADLLAIVMTPGVVDRSAAGVAQLLEVFVATTDGIYHCPMAVDDSDMGAMTCERSAWNSQLSALGLTTAGRLDPAPILNTLGNGDYALSYLGFDAITALSGPAADSPGENLGLLKVPSSGTPQVVTLDGVSSTNPEGPFMERMAFGVTESSFGLPLVMLLSGEAGERPRPRLLRAGNAVGTRYVDETPEDWFVSSLVTPRRGGFTFVDSYGGIQTQNEWFLLRLRIVPGQIDLGYVGVSDDRQSLVFSRPGGFAGNDFVLFELADSSEVVSFKNIPIVQTSSGRSPIAVIHGANRDQLGLFDWDFSLNAKWIDDLLADGYTAAQRMVTNWWFDDAGTISMLARRDGDWGVAVVAVPDFQNLRSACQ